MFNPVRLNVAFGLANIQEEYLLKTRSGSKMMDNRSMTVANKL